MTDRYENIRRALAMLDSAPAEETMTLAAARDDFDYACDPDTIRELLAERDALKVENERLRAAINQCQGGSLTACCISF